MSHFELLPVSGGAPVPVPPGLIVLGRGPLLGVGDRKVSRNHALLENSEGRLRLKPIHANPCFLQSSSDAEPRPLQKDQWCPLKSGDTLSLLPGQLCFTVLHVGEEQDFREQEQPTQRNSQVFEDKEVLPTVPAEDVQSTPIGLDQTQTPPTGKTDQSNGEEVKGSWNKNQVQSQVQSSGSPRRRVLPSWMMAAAQASVSNPSPRAVKRPKMSASGSRQTTPPVIPSVAKAPPPALSSSEGVGLSEEEEEDEQRPTKKRRMNGTKVPAAPAPRPSPDPSPGPVLGPDPGPGLSPVSSPGRAQTPSPGPISAAKDKSPTNKRTRCPYGKDCYRKNPVHFQESSHPGDPDYEDPDQEESEDRPECPYGTDCYRKNPLHRKEFKHTTRPARKTRTESKKRGADEDEDEEDEYESSFIDDDSDYEPPPSDSD